MQQLWEVPLQTPSAVLPVPQFAMQLPDTREATPVHLPEVAVFPQQ
ncbi:MAG: hypothetical protein HGB37_02720 [Candidatus Moranbacteria bacterium]|nr:hypothetical protein [Candidatus Moranbacteria bacterium]